jgi:tRNA U38,U39,U40 pseudouridine synthase TruA
MLESRDRCLAGMTAPAQGLVLWKVFYSGSTTALPLADEGENGE